MQTENSTYHDSLISATVGFADVTSANIVGYSTCDAPAAGKYKALTVSFESVTDGATVKIADLIKSGADKGAASCLDTADQMWLWDSANDDWVKYFFRTSKGQPVGWCKKGETEVTTDTVENGDTIFFRRGNGAAATTLTLSGQVKEFKGEREYTGLAAGKYRAIGYPWPVELPIAGFEKYQGAVKGAASCLDTADQMWLWDAANDDWVKYFFRTSKGQPVGWCKKGETEETKDTIPVGEGIFFRRGNGGATDTITFTYEEKTVE